MASGGSGIKSDAIGSYGAANTNANNGYNALNSSYMQMASGNDGLTPQQKADALTAAGQGIGGSTAGIVGQGALEQARTGNAGSYAAIADAAARNGASTFSNVGLGVQNQSDALANQRMMLGLQGENNLYNTNSQDALSYLNLANQAKPTFWQTLGSQAAGSALGIATGFAPH